MWSTEPVLVPEVVAVIIEVMNGKQHTEFHQLVVAGHRQTYTTNCRHIHRKRCLLRWQNSIALTVSPSEISM